MPKPTKAQIEQRIAEILSIRLAGAQFWDVKELIRERECARVNDGETSSPWQLAEGQNPLSDGQIWRYIQKADKLIASSVLASRKKALRRHQARREYLYALAVNQGDLRAALSCLDSEAKLLGLFDDELTRQLDDLQRQIAEIRGNGHRSTTAAPETAARRTGDPSLSGEADTGPTAQAP